MPVLAEDQVILDVIVNGQNIGQSFLWLTETGDVLVSPDLFSGLRLKKKFLEDQESDKISLKSLSHALTFVVDNNDAVLTITIAPRWFESQLVQPPPPTNFPERKNIVKPLFFSGFINYRIEAEYTEADNFNSYNLPWEVGFNWERWFAFSNLNYRFSNGKSEHTRLMSHIIRDDPANLNRLVIGDFAPPITNFLGGNVMGGISWGSRFSLDQKFKPYPGVNADFILETPTRAEIYNGGNLVKEWDLLPGPVRFEELNAYAGGNAVMVLRDIFGRERRIDLPQLFGGRELLRQGIQEYSYNLGFPREDFGTKSLEYGDFSGSAFHRYGFTDWFTAGLSLAFQNDLYNTGPLLGLRMGNDHLIDSEAMFSYQNGDTGYGVSTQYTYRKSNFAGGLSLLLFSRDFQPPFSSRATEEDAIQSLRYRWNLTASHSWPRWGGVSLSYADNDYWEESEERTSLLNLSYSKSIFKHFNLSVNLRKGIQGPDNQEIFISLQYTPADDRQKRFYDNMAYRYRAAAGKEIQQEISVQKYTGLGKGFGYSLTAIQNGKETGGGGRVGFRHELGIAEISLQQPPNGNMAGNLGWAGGIGIIDGGIYFGRPVIDSFAVVELEGLDNVPVYSGSSLAGETGWFGGLMMPELISYNENRIAIRPRDLPIDYESTGTERIVEMGQRGAARIKFKAFRFTAVEGNIYALTSDGDKEFLSTLPMDFVVDGESRNSFTGQDGYFYLENLPPGEQVLRIFKTDGVCNANIVVPESEAIVNNIGEVLCEPNKEK